METREEREERRGSEALSTHRGLLSLSLSWKEGVRGVVSAAGCPSLPRVLGPQGWAGLRTWGCPQPSLTMAKVKKELCFPEAQSQAQTSWGQGPYCSGICIS